jgi:hypothetical protein
MSKQSGQSMVEFAVGISVFVLLGLGGVTVAGYQEVQRRSIVAAHNAVFDAARRRGRALSATPQDSAYALHLADPGLRDAQGRALLVAREDLRVDTSEYSAPGHAAIAVGLLRDPLAVASGYLGGDFDLSGSGYERAQVTVDLNSRPYLPAPFDALDLQFTQNAAALSDAWNAGGSPHLHRRTAGLVPTQRLSGLAGLWRSLATPLRVLEPSIDHLCLGIIEPEGVPEDRLGPPNSVLPVGDRCR